MKYVGTYSDPKDIVTKEKLEAVASRVSTNEDNIAMAESDIDGLQTTVGTLQTNVNNVQTALTSKQDTVVGGASTITEDNLTASHALVSNSSGKVAVSAVTSTELGYLDGVTSNVQTQLDKKLEKAPVTSVNSKTGAVQLNATDVGALPDTTVIPTKTSQLDNDSGFITSAPVTSVNTKTGVVVLGASDVGALPADTVIPTVNNATLTIKRNNIDVGSFTANSANNVNIDINVPTDKSDIGLGNVDNVKQYSATNPPPYPVTSVNGQNGAVKGAFYVTVTQGEGTAATADKTAVEVYNAYAAGYAVYAIVKFNISQLPYILPLVFAVSNFGMVMLGFAATGAAGMNKASLNLNIAYDGADWIAFFSELASIDDVSKVLPAVTTADNGKFLRVVNGVWAAVEIANANGGSF